MTGAGYDIAEHLSDNGWRCLDAGGPMGEAERPQASILNAEKS